MSQSTENITPNRKSHWRFLYHHRRRSANASTKQIIAGQIFTVIVSIAAGLWLDNLKHSIIAFTGALVLMPGIVDLSASLAGSLGAKIHHLIELNEGTIPRILAGSIGFSLLLAVLSGGLVGLVGGGIGVLFFDSNLLSMLELMILSMIIIGVVIYPIVAMLVLIIRRFGWNPDNLVGPIQSSLVDVWGIIVIAVVAGWLK